MEVCNWPLAFPCPCPEYDSADPAVQLAAEQWATYILWAFTGRQFGPCPVTVRPCYRPCNVRSYLTFGVWMDGYGTGDTPIGWMPYVDGDGDWRNCGCFGLCCCGASCEVWLPGPVASIDSVLINNVALDPAAYRVDDYLYLVRQDGDCWPECQNFDVPPASTDRTFVVTYQLGKAVPLAGQLAAGVLACEFVKGWCGAADCALPPNVTSITRSGVSFEVLAPDTLFEDGLTGIRRVDDWIRAVNPGKLREAPSVSSPDLRDPRMQTWP